MSDFEEAWKDSGDISDQVWAVLEGDAGAKLLARVSRAESTLRDLLRLKEYKDRYGKTKAYLERQPKVWEAAKEALAALKGGVENV